MSKDIFWLIATIAIILVLAAIAIALSQVKPEPDMGISKQTKNEVRKYLKYDLDGLLKEMTQYLDEKTKIYIDNRAIEIVASDHNTTFEIMKKSVDSPTWESMYGGEVATLYFQLLKDEVERRIRNEKELLKEAVCTNFSYCEKKKNGIFQSDDYSFAVALTDALISYTSQFPFPVATIVTYILKKGILDDWCECN